LALAATGVARADGNFVEDALGERGRFACLSAQELELALSLNEYRTRNRLPAIATSRSLTAVSRIHAIDLAENRPELETDDSGAQCTLHSWSGRGPWRPFCYTADNRTVLMMLEKPWEVTRGAYPGRGYENVYWTSAPEALAALALDTWQTSPDHDALLLEKGEWEGSGWQALGVGIYRNMAVLWLGSAPDPLGPPAPCETAGGTPAAP
jgi:hypothetical protein